MQTSRRHFLKSYPDAAGRAGRRAVAAHPKRRRGRPGARRASAALPRRQLGKSGPQVTMLCMGGMMAALSPDYIDIAWSMGIRYFDTADCYIDGQVGKNLRRSGSPNIPNAARKFFSSPRIIRTRARSSCWT